MGKKLSSQPGNHRPGVNGGHRSVDDYRKKVTVALNGGRTTKTRIDSGKDAGGPLYIPKKNKGFF